MSEKQKHKRNQQAHSTHQDTACAQQTQDTAPTNAEQCESADNNACDSATNELRQLKQCLADTVSDNERLTNEVVKLNKTVARLQSSADNSDKYRDQLVALKADFDSYRRRMRQDAEANKQQGVCDAVIKMLPVLDDLVRAKQHIGSEELVALEMMITTFEKALAELGVTKLDVQGQTFDALTMNALSVVDMGEENKGKVVEVYKTGYLMGDKVLRYAEVIVGA